MIIDTIDGALLRDMFLAGASLLEKNRALVDSLNVFPVPDGDTGTGATPASSCLSCSVASIRLPGATRSWMASPSPPPWRRAPRPPTRPS